ncbi:hypothetical protein FSP39_019082 [Pinctada imbricata]|uniref:Uncharacterized protein n=1 Tax=Pinctada imbricata TaxID=66713 RepID=A0AA88Y0V3_PINIB|nr:hypothetical protein FSP39_019082 [Pinctada imbricata]
MVDYEDWRTTPGFFSYISSIWGPFTIDRFASHINTKLPRFNSVFWNPGTEHIDCFSVDWSKENNWLVPPVSLIGKCLRYIVECKAKGTLIVPKWPSSYFWPLLFSGQNFKHFILEVLEFHKANQVFEQGMNRNSIFGTKITSSSVLAIRFDSS